MRGHALGGIAGGLELGESLEKTVEQAACGRLSFWPKLFWSRARCWIKETFMVIFRTARWNRGSNLCLPKSSKGRIAILKSVIDENIIRIYLNINDYLIKEMYSHALIA